MAARTWLGSRVLAVQAEPDATAKPRRSNSCTRASPSTYRALNVTTCGSRSSGSPATSTSATAPAADRTRSTRARASSDSPARCAAVCCHASAAASARGTHGTWPPGPCPGSPAGPGTTQRVRSGTTRTPTPPGPPQDWASPASTSKEVGEATRPRDAWASTTSGMPALRHTSWTCWSGWRVPTSPLACCTAAPTVPGTATASARAAGSTRPCRSTGIVAKSVSSPACAARCCPGTRTAECSTAPATRRAPRRRPAWRTPSTAHRTAIGRTA